VQKSHANKEYCCIVLLVLVVVGGDSGEVEKERSCYLLIEGFQN
jgi:hypothetical protein